MIIAKLHVCRSIMNSDVTPYRWVTGNYELFGVTLIMLVFFTYNKLHVKLGLHSTKRSKVSGQFELLTQKRFEVDAKLDKFQFCIHLRCILCRV